MFSYICSKCGKSAPYDKINFRCECGGLYNLDFSPPEFTHHLIDKQEFSIFRYRAFMPVDEYSWRSITLGEGATGVARLCDDVFVKLEYAMPTLSFKDRGAAVIIAHAKNIGVKKVIQDSSGNAGNSVAAYCARAGIECEIYVPRGTSPKKIGMIQSHGATVTVYDGTRDETAEACRRRAEDEGIYYANHVYDPLFYQGTKTFVYELFEQLGKLPDNIFIPTGNGTLLLGCIIGIKELFAAKFITKCPKLYIVQSENCAPLYNAVGVPREVRVLPTLAEGIAIGKPMRGEEILNANYPGETEVILAPEPSILPAREHLSHVGYFVEHTTAATYAAYVAYARDHDIIGTSLFPLCGAGLKSEK